MCNDTHVVHVLEPVGNGSERTLLGAVPDGVADVALDGVTQEVADEVVEQLLVLNIAAADDVGLFFFGDHGISNRIIHK